jgi:pyrimidine-specific ribonucleoside hydrolase
MTCRRLISCSFLLLPLLAGGQDWVVIDTDGAADDLRAICLLLAAPSVEICAIVTSEGALSPGEATRKVRALLRAAGREEIPVGTGRALDLPPPRWREQSRRVSWGDEREDDAPPPPAPAVALLREVIRNAACTFVALGALTNLADLLDSLPAAQENIPRVIWYNGHDDLQASANHAADPAAAARVLSSGIPVRIISGERLAITINPAFVEAISSIDAPLARLLVAAHRSDALRRIVDAGHMKTWDDLAALYLLDPTLFTARPYSPSVSLLVLDGEKAVTRAMALIITLLSN